MTTNELPKPMNATVNSATTGPLLRPWDVGAAVVELQELLQAHGFRVSATGEFNSQTEDAVQIFQRRQGLRVDAIIGPKTWAALKTTVKLGDRILRKGLTGLDVYELQGLLRVNGFDIPRDGFFGPLTHQAVVQFQQRHKLRDDGKVDRLTCSILQNPG